LHRRDPRLTALVAKFDETRRSVEPQFAAPRHCAARIVAERARALQLIILLLCIMGVFASNLAVVVIALVGWMPTIGCRGNAVACDFA
jgi:hypothetical protein